MAHENDRFAFPQPDIAEYSDDARDRLGGMTLRDWFAGRAPDAPADYMWDERPDSDDYKDRHLSDFERDHDAWRLRRTAVWAYAYADAMLAARGKQ
jgi:hypothetical protein